MKLHDPRRLSREDPETEPAVHSCDKKKPRPPERLSSMYSAFWIAENPTMEVRSPKNEEFEAPEKDPTQELAAVPPSGKSGTL